MKLWLRRNKYTIQEYNNFTLLDKVKKKVYNYLLILHEILYSLLFKIILMINW